MAKAVWFVLCRAFEGRREEMWEWYSKAHIADILAIPGVKRARLWKLEGRLPGQDASHDTLALYDLEADDIAAPLKEAGARMGGPQMPRSPTLDSSKTLTFVSRIVVEMDGPDVELTQEPGS